jgi:hypothetical protein
MDKRVRDMKSANGMKFYNYSVENFTTEQQSVLKWLRSNFLPRAPGTHQLDVNTVYSYNAPHLDALDGIISNGMDAKGRRDAGYFGVGVYSTLNIEYALQYAAPNPSGRYAVIMFASFVSMAYPVTVAVDCTDENGHSVLPSKLHGQPLINPFDGHVVCVNYGRATSQQVPDQAVDTGDEKDHVLAVPAADCRYVELVLKEKQMLPVAILWFVKS